MERIRRLEPEDSFDELTALLHRAYGALGAMGFNYTAVDQLAETTRERALDGCCYVVVREGKIVATATFGLVDRMARPPEYARAGMAYFTQFAVEPELQGTGIGSRLLRHVEEEARASGATEIALDTAEGATHLVDYYAARGYAPEGNVRRSGKSYRSVILVKRLGRRGG